MKAPVFILGKRLFKRMQAIRSSRRYRACKDMLCLIGQFCVDQYLDGEVTEHELRRKIDDTSQWRVMRGYLDLLISCGALEPTPWGTYAIAFYLDRNLPGKLRAEKNAATKEKERKTAAKKRARRPIELTNETVTKSGNLPVCQSYISFKGVQTPTNKTPVAEAECRASIVPPKKSVVSEETGPVDFDAIARRMMALQSAALQPRRDESKEKLGLETGAALHWGLLGEGVGVVPGPQQSPPTLARPIKAAKMPRDSVRANLGTAAQALRDLGVNPSQDEQLHAELWRRGVREVEVGYAVWSIQRQRGMGRRVAHTIPYMLSIITKQRQYRGERCQI